MPHPERPIHRNATDKAATDKAPVVTTATAGTGKPQSHFKITSADGAPLAIEPGKYYINTKARCKRMMFDSLSSDARRVYACLELHTMGFRQELAVVMEADGKTRPLTPSDIAKETELLRQNVTRGLVELEQQGLAERRCDDEKGLRKGKTRLYSFATPRTAKGADCNPARLQYPAYVSDSQGSILRRFHVTSLPSDPTPEVLSALARIEQDYKNLKNEIGRITGKESGPITKPAAYKEERKERNIERKSDPPAFPTIVEAPAEEASKPAPGWHAFLYAATKAGMCFPRRGPLLEQLEQKYRELPEKEQLAATEGILNRTSIGEYGDSYTPDLKRYLWEWLWTQPYRRKPLSAAEQKRRAQDESIERALAARRLS